MRKIFQKFNFDVVAAYFFAAAGIAQMIEAGMHKSTSGLAVAGIALLLSLYHFTAIRIDKLKEEVACLKKSD